MATDKQPSETIQSIQFLRFVAAAIVVLHHAFNRAAIDHSGLAGHIFETGAAGVHIFFVISGFVMMHVSLGEGEAFSGRSFLERRFVRIYPVYWFFCALTIALALATDFSGPPPLLSTLAGLMLLPGFSSLNQGWTLTYEIYFYLFFAAFWSAGRLRGIAALSGLFFVAVALGFVFKPQTALFQLITSPLLLEFIAGIWIAYYLSTPRPRWVAHATWLGVLGWGLTLAIDSHRIPLLVAWGGPSVLLLLGMVRAEQLGLMPRWIGRTKPLGDASYSLYLCHILLIDLAITLFGRPPQSLPAIVVFCFVSLIVCSAVAIWIYRGIEVPAVRWFRGWLRAWVPVFFRSTRAKPQI